MFLDYTIDPLLPWYRSLCIQGHTFGDIASLISRFPLRTGAGFQRDTAETLTAIIAHLFQKRKPGGLSTTRLTD